MIIELLSYSINVQSINYNFRFRVLPDCIYNLRGLEILLARDNQIEQIDASGNGFGAMRRLCILDLANNNIDYIPPMLGYLKNIT